MAEEKPRIAMVRPTKDKSAGAQTLRILEKKYRIYPEAEIIPYARNTSFVEIAENVATIKKTISIKDSHSDSAATAEVKISPEIVEEIENREQIDELEKKPR